MTTDIRLYFDCTSKKTYIKDFTDYNTSEFPYNLQIDSAATLFDPTNNLIIDLVDFTIDKSTIPNVTDEYSLNVTTSNNIIPGNYKLNYTNGYTFNQSGEDLNMSFLSGSIISIPFSNLGLIWAAGDTFIIDSATDSDNNGTYTVSEIAYDTNLNLCYITATTDTFVVPETPGPDDTAQFIFSWKYIPIYTDKIYTYTSCSSVTPCITANYDCTSTPYGNIIFEDSSTYPTGVVADSKEFTIYYPNGLDFSQSPNPDNYTIDNPLIVDDVSYVSISTLATGTWSAKLVLTTSQTQVDGLIVVNSSSSIKEFNVSCTSNMCGLSSCLTKLRDRHISYLKSSSVSPLQQYVDNVQLLYTMAKEAQACGDKNTYEKYIAEIFEVVKQTDTSCGCGCSGSCSGSCSCGGCDDGCGCGETGPTWVNNIGIDIRSLIQELALIPDQVEALQTNVDGLTDDVSALNEWTGLGLPLPPAYNSLYGAVNGLMASVSDLGNEIDTGDLSGLTARVTVLEEEVVDLQEQIDALGSSNSEVSVYELMTNSGTQKSVWTATSGSAPGATDYTIIIPGNVESSFPNGTKISFFNPPTGAWFYGGVEEASFSGGSTNIGVLWQNGDFDNGASWQDSIEQFLVYKGGMSTSDYNFTQTLTLDNDAYWKFDTENVKYWSKIKASFVVNEPTIGNQLPIFMIKNSTSNKDIYLRSIPCGTIVDLELSFEKLYDQPTGFYDCVTLIDAKYNTSDNIALSEDGAILFGGHSGFNPHEGYGIDLNDGGVGNYYQLGIPESLENTSSVQDVVNNSGDGTFDNRQNANRKISRYATGPSYPNNTAPNFFTGTLAETIVFNFSNINITLFNIEQSFGRMSVNLA
jgi:hypothetical protein